MFLCNRKEAQLGSDEEKRKEEEEKEEEEEKGKLEKQNGKQKKEEHSKSKKEGEEDESSQEATPLCPQDSKVTLDKIVTRFLRDQHRHCANPVELLPPFSLHYTHHCPVPSKRLETLLFLEISIQLSFFE